MNSAANIVVASNGQVWVADTDEVAPDDVETSPADLSTSGEGWAEVGFISEDGATFSQEREVTDIGAWQSFFPVRSIVTGQTLTLAFAMREWSTTTVEFFFSDTATAETYTPPQPDEQPERSVIVDWQDNAKHYRLYIPRGAVTGPVEFQLTRTAAADLPVSIKVLDPGSESSGSSDVFLPAYMIFSDDPALDASS